MILRVAPLFSAYILMLIIPYKLYANDCNGSYYEMKIKNTTDIDFKISKHDETENNLCSGNCSICKTEVTADGGTFFECGVEPQDIDYISHGDTKTIYLCNEGKGINKDSRNKGSMTYVSNNNTFKDTTLTITYNEDAHSSPETHSIETNLTTAQQFSGFFQTDDDSPNMTTTINQTAIAQKYNLKSIGLGTITSYACGKPAVVAEDGKTYINCPTSNDGDFDNVMRVYFSNSTKSCAITFNSKGEEKDINCDQNAIGYDVADPSSDTDYNGTITFLCQQKQGGTGQCGWAFANTDSTSNNLSAIKIY
ncbi:hypothetical protein L3V82_03980 [Thiotrichales bacterium 19S3-7]|nr:hypothetical protein [Thiotrichales bacterium 19S3-7]MCF6801833.1 hypothetical protein [Thiotrichales bacterium 19S3-11]